jgi:hypothetical protein
MAGEGDYQFQTPGDGPARSPGDGSGSFPKIALVAGAVILIAVAAYFVLGRRTPPSQPASTAAKAAPAAAKQEADDFEHLDLPSLDDSDSLVRQRIGILSSHPLVMAWLGTTGLVRNFVVVIENLSHGMNPSGHLRVLKPKGAFMVMTRGAQTVIDPRSYDRFSGIAGAAASIDARAAGRLYGSFKPLLQAAYDELGNQEPIDRAVGRAIGMLAQVPAPGQDLAVEKSGEGIGYRYADPKLEALNGAQKQLLRMGPDHVRAIQEQLRSFASAAHVAVAP